MRKTFLSLVVLTLLSLCGFKAAAQHSACDLWVENNSAATLTNISFTSPIDMVSFSNIAASGGTQAGILHYVIQDDVTVALFFSNPPVGAKAAIYNSSSSTPDGVISIQPGLNIFQLNGPIASGAIWVRIN
ncbi:hypothetical protein [Taibaiella koreensis]|uniref:hypothetical protein n=1 Tax=Taibaiella koreensis TaxID=1268548 RepID=UPI0013C30E9A|nr:hypothetical protein [Taibaiella koreensis]